MARLGVFELLMNSETNTLKDRNKNRLKDGETWASLLAFMG